MSSAIASVYRELMAKRLEELSMSELLTQHTIFRTTSPAFFHNAEDHADKALWHAHRDKVAAEVDRRFASLQPRAGEVP